MGPSKAQTYLNQRSTDKYPEIPQKFWDQLRALAAGAGACPKAKQEGLPDIDGALAHTTEVSTATAPMPAASSMSAVATKSEVGRPETFALKRRRK